jgi:D-glycero-alpha-D-manno-heptose-7-phosphate kinase
MIICRTPFRVSFFGGGTDYPAWYEECAGAVLAMTINKYGYISCRHLPPFFDYISRIVYSKIETVKSNEKIKHPAIRGVLQYLKVKEGVEIHYNADLPARAGLGSSSSFTVGLLHALYALKQVMPTKLQLAREAIYVEQEILKENVGCQDQIMAAHGNLCRVEFHSNHDFQITPVIVSQPRLENFQSHLMLFFTGLSRTASDLAGEQIACTKERKRELTLMYQMVEEGTNILTGQRDLAEFGALLDESWKLKRSLTSRISSPRIDAIYETARAAGALGGKLLGAGGGGFMLLFARPEAHAQIKEKLKGLLHVPCELETSGTQIIVYELDQPAPKEARPNLSF